jgi:type II secretion system protein G
VTSRRAFTLIELLIVVAIIAILAAIAVPNFLEAQMRSKVSRVKADMRSMATAMESYAVDWNRYPMPSDADGAYVPDPIAATNVNPFETRSPILLTTPVAYMTSLPEDPFAVDRFSESRWYTCVVEDYVQVRQTYAPTVSWIGAYRRFFRDLYGHDPATTVEYFFQSWGPDKVHDADVPHTGPSQQPHVHGSGALYDPTNGTVSKGDIIYFGPGFGFGN